jgi:hypothetical protein
MAADYPPYSKYLIKAMRRGGESTEVRCDAHPARDIEFYDKKDRKYKCTECVMPFGVTKVTKRDIKRTQKLLVVALKE